MVRSNEYADTEPTSAVASGFRGSLRCSSIADVIQLECLSGTRAIVSVASRGREGLLFFDDGRITHAIQGDLTQEAAALEILGWEGGTFEPKDLDWPARAAMAATWQHLIMLVAQRRDEANRHPEIRPAEPAKRLPSQQQSSELGAPPPKPAALRPLRSVNLETNEKASPITPRPTLEVSGTTPVPRAAVRLGPNGEVVRTRGEAQSLVALAAYLKRLGDLIGQDLGAKRLETMTCQLRSSHVWLFAEADGSCTAVEAAPDVPRDFVRSMFEQLRSAHG